MFPFKNIRIVRKLMILTILLGGLFFAVSFNDKKASAEGCCSVDCDEPYYACVADCNAAYPNDPQARWACVQDECFPSYYFCMQHCDPGC